MTHVCTSLQVSAVSHLQGLMARGDGDQESEAWWNWKDVLSGNWSWSTLFSPRANLLMVVHKPSFLCPQEGALRPLRCWEPGAAACLCCNSTCLWLLSFRIVSWALLLSLGLQLAFQIRYSIQCFLFVSLCSFPSGSHLPRIGRRPRTFSALHSLSWCLVQDALTLTNTLSAFTCISIIWHLSELEQQPLQCTSLWALKMSWGFQVGAWGSPGAKTLLFSFLEICPLSASHPCWFSPCWNYPRTHP